VIPKIICLSRFSCFCIFLLILIIIPLVRKDHIHCLVPHGLFLSFLIIYYLLRELNKKYEVLLIILFLVFLLFLVSEGLLFVSFFWTSFHSLSSPSLGIWPAEGFYVPDPCELTFANTLLLSNAAISLGNAFISLETRGCGLEKYQPDSIRYQISDPMLVCVLEIQKTGH